MKKPVRFCASLALAVLFMYANPVAQAWTSKPVRVVVPLSAGGGVGTVGASSP